MAEILRNRPLLLFAIGMIVGLTIREFSWNALLLLPLGLLVKDWRRVAGLVLGFLLGGILSPSLPSQGVMDRQFVQSVARVVSVPRLYPDRIVYEVELQGRRLSVSEPSSVDRSLGDRLSLTGLVRPLREGSEDYLLAKAIVGRLEPMSVEARGDGPVLYRAANNLRRSFVAFTHRIMPPEQAAILDALCFNVEGGLTDTFEDNLRATGTIHIISASGLHVLLLAWILDLILGLLPIPRPWRLLFLSFLLIFYAAAAGLQPAIIRSVLMSILALSAYLWRRESDLLTNLALAAIAYLIFDPVGIFNIGFQFSFFTVVAFALFGRLRDSFPRTAWGVIREQAHEALQTANAAYWATLPLLVFYFGAISIVAIPANLLIVPVVEALIIGGMAGYALAALIPGVGPHIGTGLLSPMTSCLEATINLFGTLIRLNIPTPSFSGYWLIPIYTIMCWRVSERIRPA